jgi:hypothetical protein
MEPCEHRQYAIIPPPEAHMAVHQNFINGEWAKQSAGAPNINPSNAVKTAYVGP